MLYHKICKVQVSESRAILALWLFVVCKCLEFEQSENLLFGHELILEMLYTTFCIIFCITQRRPRSDSLADSVGQYKTAQDLHSDLLCSLSALCSTCQKPASYCHGVVSMARTCLYVNFFFKKLLRDY